MIVLAMVALALQGGSGTWRVTPAHPTVGDTVRIERAIPVTGGATARAQPLAASDLLQPLGRVVIVPGRGVIRLRYTAAFFTPGAHAVPMPSLELIYPDGRTETVLGDSAVVDVASVLPAGDSTPTPKASLAPIARPPRRPVALIVPIAAVLILLVLWGIWRRRRGAEPALPAPDETGGEPPLERWLAAGEGRAVAAVTAEQLRATLEATVPGAHRALGLGDCLAVIEDQRPEWPVRELEEVLRALERARFAPLAPDDAVALRERAETLRLELLRVEGRSVA